MYFDTTTSGVVAWQPATPDEPIPGHYLPVSEEMLKSMDLSVHRLVVEDGTLVLAGDRIFIDLDATGDGAAVFIHERMWGDRPLPVNRLEVSKEDFAALMQYTPGRQMIRVVDGRARVVDVPAPVLTYEQLLASVHAQRKAAYVAESDPIKNEADYDALVSGRTPDYTAWMAAVEAIKARYPLPEPEPEAA